MSKLIKRAYKFRFYPQEDLKIVLAKTFGYVSFVYNQTLDYSEKHYAQKDRIENYKSLTSSSSCHANHDRDENACLNLFNYQQSTVGTTANACGGNVRPKVSKNINSMKLEATSNEAGIPLL